jgi:hypothetical protein
MVQHPKTEEAEYCRAQIQNIVQSVVPKQELLEAQADLARAHLENEGPPDVKPATVRPFAWEFPA